MIAPYRVKIALRLMKDAGACFEAARGIVEDARRHRDDVEFVRQMVRMAQAANRIGVETARAARKWVQP